MEETKKNNKGLYAIIAILCVALLGLGGFVVYDKFIKEDSKENKPTNTNKEDKNVKTKDKILKETTLSNDDEIVKKLANKVINVYPTNSIGNFEYEDYIYKKDIMNLEDENIKFKLSLAAESIKLDFARDDTTKSSYISEEKLKEAYFELFGKDSIYSRSNFIVDDCARNYNWSNENNRYESPLIDGCGGTVLGGTHGEFAYAKQIKNNAGTDIIEIYEYFISVNPVKGIYSDYKQTDLIVEGEINSSDYSTIISENKDKVGLYKHKFVKDTNGTYVYTSVEKVR